MENLGDRRIVAPDNRPNNDANIQDGNANAMWSNQEDPEFQDQPFPPLDSRGRGAPRNDGRPLIDMSLRNQPRFDPRMGNDDPLRYNFGPRQDLGPQGGSDARFPGRGGAGVPVYPGRASPRRAVDRRALGLRDDRQIDAVGAAAAAARMARSADGNDDVVENAEQIYINPAVARAAVVSANNLGGSLQQQQQQHHHQQQEEQQQNTSSFSHGRGETVGVEDFARYIQERMETSEILHGQSYKTEYEVIAFNRFIVNRIYMVDPGLGKRVVEKPIGSKKRDINEILFQAVDSLNKNRTGLSLYTYDHFVEGIYRSEPALGAHYELYFTNLDDKNGGNSPGFHGNSFHTHQRLYTNSYVRVSLFRPFAPPQMVQQSVVDTGPEWINLVLPLSGRVDTFRAFMDQFISVCIKQDRRVYLTVVYFGVDGLKEVKTIMSRAAKTHRFKHMKLVTLNETFTRGRGLRIGTLNWKGAADVLMFFCDVDIMFTAEFFERCRLNSEKGKRVYYPIVFSLYNPKIVYSLQDIPTPSLLDQLVLSKDTGFWRDFGYGMTCQYRSDFLNIKGFDEQITGWGGEDVSLYQKFVRSEYFVVRATDPAIFHLWHEKSCDPNLSAEQYRSCIRSKALNEASHSQLGLLAFKDEIDVHRSVKERNKVLLRTAAMGGANAAIAGSLDARRKDQVPFPTSRVAPPQR
ncbi:hypothetical protein EGW08_007150 [Elysia chlorotica]|uniref:Hexosyltransferase n=1 Tax=Elysia chlorotica TaxID=188477 RepID=A0A3S0ZX02_ELYCH|nr:hypothetical protein EGW08_007150 [Elysia chlorotica]